MALEESAVGQLSLASREVVEVAVPPVGWAIA